MALQDTVTRVNPGHVMADAGAAALAIGEIALAIFNRIGSAENAIAGALVIALLIMRLRAQKRRDTKEKDKGIQ